MGLARTTILATTIALACLAATTPALAAAPALIGNGGFETTSLAPWTESSSGARVVDQSEWTPASGKKSAEVSDDGWLYQDVATTAFQRYDLSFAMSGNPGCGGGQRSVQVSWNPYGGAASGYGANQALYTFDTTGNTTASMGWQTEHVLVDAGSSTTGVSFRDPIDVGCGAAIDDVTMQPAAAGQTGVRITSPEEQPVAGETPPISATVVGASTAVTPTGSVQFSLDGSPVGGPVTLANGTAQAPFGPLSPGVYDITASYVPDSASYAPSSGSYRLTVGKAATATALDLDQTDVPAGQEVVLTATTAAVAPGSGQPTGTVQFSDELGPLGDPVPVDDQGVASIAVTEDVGDHWMSAVYNGDDDFLTSGAGRSLTVYDPNPPTDTGGGTPTRVATTVTLTSSKTAVPPGDPYTVTATVAPSTPSSALLDGTIAFTVNNAAVGSPVSLDANHSASATLTMPSTGTVRQSVLASYSGNASYLGSRGLLSVRPLLPVTVATGLSSPVAPPPVAPLDTSAPTFTYSVIKPRLRVALAKGVEVVVACNERCSYSVQLALSAARARALGIRTAAKSLVIAHGVHAAGNGTLDTGMIRFGKRYRRALAKASKLTLRATVSVKDMSGNQAVRTGGLTLKR